jgi:hypothetical protein
LLLLVRGNVPSSHAQPLNSTIAPDSLPLAVLSTDSRVIELLKDVHGVRHRIRTVIRDSAAWAAFAQTLGDRSHTILPSVDFGHEMLIVASNGLRNNGEFISIERVDVRPDTLLVHVLTRTHVMPDCRDAAMYAPMTIVRVPHDRRPVAFVERKQDEGCGFPLKDTPK